MAHSSCPSIWFGGGLELILMSTAFHDKFIIWPQPSNVEAIYSLKLLYSCMAVSRNQIYIIQPADTFSIQELIVCETGSVKIVEPYGEKRLGHSRKNAVGGGVCIDKYYGPSCAELYSKYVIYKTPLRTFVRWD